MRALRIAGIIIILDTNDARSVLSNRAIATGIEIMCSQGACCPLSRLRQERYVAAHAD
jgi:hypothetical protein